MMRPGSQDPEIVICGIPRIEVYQVVDYELRAIEEGYGQVGQDLAFALAALSACLTLVVSLKTAAFSPGLRATFWALSLVLLLVAIYTGARWLRTRKAVPMVIATIRARRVQPQAGVAASPTQPEA